MVTYRSDFSKYKNHSEVIIFLNTDIKVWADWILGYFEKEIVNGTIFRSEETVQIGWMLIMLKADKHGNLEVWEPEFSTIPISWIRGANNTVRHLALQNEVCAQVHIEPAFPSLRQFGMITDDLLCDAGDCEMYRNTPEEAFSGWTFSPADLRSSHTPHSLFEIAIKHPISIYFMALPVGTRILYSKQKIEISYGSMRISSDQNEFLRKLLMSNPRSKNGE